MIKILIFMTLIILIVFMFLNYDIRDTTLEQIEEEEKIEKNIEHYSGALTQLYAKGAQDTYLYGDVYKYNDPYWYLWPEQYTKYPHGYYIGKYPYYQFEFNYKTYGHF